MIFKDKKLSNFFIDLLTGFGSVTAPVSGFSTITIDRFLTIGARTGSAVTFSIADSSFIVEARGGGDVTINLW